MPTHCATFHCFSAAVLIFPFSVLMTITYTELKRVQVIKRHNNRHVRIQNIYPKKSLVAAKYYNVSMVIITYYIPYSGKIWRALNLANWLIVGIGDF